MRPYDIDLDHEIDPVADLALWQTQRRAIEILEDLEKGGFLREYLLKVKTQATEALHLLADADPANLTLIAAIQRKINLYVDAFEFAKSILHDGYHAEEMRKIEG